MIRHHAPIGHARPRQRGAVLVISLLILLIMTLIGITGMQTSVLEERMAGNYRDIALAFQASETALRDAESRIRDSIDGLTGFSDACTDGLCDATSETIAKYGKTTRPKGSPWGPTRTPPRMCSSWSRTRPFTGSRATRSGRRAARCGRASTESPQ